MRSEGTPEPTGGTAHEEANPAARGIRVAGYDLPLKWLVIGGATVVVAVIVVAVVFALGSIGTSTSNTLLAFVPSDSTSVHLQETKMILSGSAPDKYLDAYESAWEYLDDLGFSIYEIERQVESTDIESGNRLLVLQGDFVFADIRDELSETWNYQNSEYRGNELWEGRDWAWAAVALFEQENIVLMANRREAIREVFRNLEDGSGSLADEKDSRMRQFLEETSDGWVGGPSRARRLQRGRSVPGVGLFADGARPGLRQDRYHNAVLQRSGRGKSGGRLRPGIRLPEHQDGVRRDPGGGRHREPGKYRPRQGHCLVRLEREKVHAGPGP